MAAPKKYPDELRERATRMAVEARRDPSTKAGALARVAQQPGLNPETLRAWCELRDATRVSSIGVARLGAIDAGTSCEDSENRSASARGGE